jgi:biopolymer transport protein ExbD
MFELEQERVHSPEPDLVPILDGLTAVIFFLLLSVSFVGLTKVTLPPSASSVSTSSNDKPVSARLRALTQGSTVLLRLEWLGNRPGSLKENVLRGQAGEKNKALLEAVREMTEKFKNQYPNENTLQLALAENMTYQEMISIMDGALLNIKDIALSSYTEAIRSDEAGE